MATGFRFSSLPSYCWVKIKSICLCLGKTGQMQPRLLQIKVLEIYYGDKVTDTFRQPSSTAVLYIVNPIADILYLLIIQEERGDVWKAGQSSEGSGGRCGLQRLYLFLLNAVHGVWSLLFVLSAAPLSSIAAEHWLVFQLWITSIIIWWDELCSPIAQLGTFCLFVSCGLFIFFFSFFLFVFSGHNWCNHFF